MASSISDISSGASGILIDATTIALHERNQRRIQYLQKKLLETEDKLAESPDDDQLATAVVQLRTELTTRVSASPPTQPSPPAPALPVQPVASTPASAHFKPNISQTPPIFKPFLTNARSFMRELEAYLIAQCIPASHHLPTLLQTCFHDEQAADLVLEAINTNQSWNDTKEVFLATFANPLLQDFATLTECKQGFNEPITVFVNRFRQLINNLSADSSNDDIASTFIANLTPYYRAQLRTTLRNADAVCEMLQQAKPIIDWRQLMTLAMKITPSNNRFSRAGSFFKTSRSSSGVASPSAQSTAASFSSSQRSYATPVAISRTSSTPIVATPATVLPTPTTITVPLCSVCNNGRHPPASCWFNPASSNYKGQPWRGKRTTKLIQCGQQSSVNSFTVIIDGFTISALLDTGSDTSILDSKFVSEHKLPLTPTSAAVTVANGSVMDIQASTDAKIQYANTELTHSFFVAPLPDCTCIIGSDLYPQLGISILFPSSDTPTRIPPSPDIPTPTQILPAPSIPLIVESCPPLQEALAINAAIPSTAFCTLPYAQIDIPLKTTSPIFKRQYPLPLSAQPVIAKQVEEWLADGRIAVAAPNTQFNLPLTVAPKKDNYGNSGPLRVCLDPRSINNSLEADHFPIPRIEDIKARLLGKAIFSELDLRSAFLQLPVNPLHRHILSFSVTLNGKTTQYSFQAAPFGLSHLSSCFQRIMSTCFQHLDFVLVYIDNIIIASSSPSEHLDHLIQVIRLLNSANLRLNVAKSKFAQTRLPILGFLVTSAGITLDPAKVEAIRSVALPRTVKALQSFLGMVNFLRAHIPFASAHTSILDRNRSETVLAQTLHNPLDLVEYESAFQRLKDEVANAIMITAPDFSKPFKLACDASSTAVASMLYQDHGVLAVSSRSLTPYERRYPIFKKELLAIVDALRSHYAYLWGQPEPFLLYTDHSALQYLQKSKLHPTLASWQIFIAEFKFKIAHIPGVSNVVPDALSRLPTLLTTVPRFTFQVRVAIQPTTEQFQLIQESHQLGHFGLQATLHDLRQRRKLDWPGIAAHVSRVIADCTLCQQYNDGYYQHDPLRQTTVSLPWHRVFMDTATDFPEYKGFKHLLVLVDSFTRFVALRPLQDRKQETVIAALQSVFSELGVPSEVQTDVGTEYTNHLLQEYFTSFGIQPRLHTSYVHHQNGLAERVIRTLTNLFKKLLHGRNNWTDHLAAVSLFYNNRVHSQTNSTPFQLMFNRRPVLLPTDPLFTTQQWTSEFQRYANLHYPVAAKTSTRQAALQHKNFNKRHRSAPKPIPLGSFCMIIDPHAVDKFAPSYIGPYQVMEVMSNHHYLLKNDSGYLKRLVPRSHCKVIPAPKDASYQVETILAHKIEHGTTYYQVKWRGYHRPTWEPSTNIDDPALISRYHELNRP
jgi:transposase InsO family protein